MKKHLIYAAILWVALTAVGIIWALNTGLFFPMAAAEEADLIDEAFRLLLILSVPVAALVLAMLGYSVIRFRTAEEIDEDGPPIRTHRPIAIGWFVITTFLVIFVVFNPGLKGLEELEGSSHEDLVIQIEGEQWHWNVTYPEYELSYERALQIALPVDTPVKFEITSVDVIHSFWVPAFRMKMDALPHQTTTLTVTPTETGSFESDPNMRVQCAELCGTGHPNMRMALRVLEPDEFDQWIQEAREMTGGGMEMDMGMDMESGDMDMESGDMDMESDSDMQMDEESGMDMDGGEDHDDGNH